MLKRTRRLLFALLALFVSDVGYYMASEQNRMLTGLRQEIIVLETTLTEEQDLHREDTELYKEQLLGIVEAVYTKELSMGGYDTESGVEVTSIYDAIMNDVRDYRDTLDIVANYFDSRTDYIDDIPSIWPVPYSQDIYVTSGYGWRVSPITGNLGFHPAFDIAGPAGTKILATADGVLVENWPAPNGYFKGHPDLGGLVIIKHDSGYLTRYGHMSKLLVRSGDHVKRGQVIGIMGSTGSSTGLHVHYEVMLNGRYVNPAELLQF